VRYTGGRESLPEMPAAAKSVTDDRSRSQSVLTAPLNCADFPHRGFQLESKHENTRIVIFHDRGRAWIRLVGSAALALVAIFLAVEDRSAFGAMVALFFGVCTFSCAAILLRGVRLELRDDGFQIRAPFGERNHRWQEVKRFGYSGLGPAKIVCFELVKRPERTGLLPLLTHTLSGFDYGIPNVLTLSPDNLVEELRGWHARATD
jgi:hypothetical protein